MLGVSQKPKNVSKKDFYIIKIIVQEDKTDSLNTPGPTHYIIKDLSNKGPAWKISETKRKPLKGTSYTDRCGDYKYKSFIGEGPKYSFGKNINLMGNLEEKRHKKKEADKPVPGPGAYNIIPEFDGPKFSMGNKRLQKSLSQNNILVPGVGSYDIRKDSTFEVPCYKFDREKREDLNINSSTLKNPGPGHYSNDIDVNSSASPIWTFGKTERFKKLIQKNSKSKSVVLDVPGPGQYRHEEIFGREGPHYSFPKEKFNHSDCIDEYILKKKRNYPSPVTYSRLSYIPDMPKYSLSKIERSKLDSLEMKFKTLCPGPGDYNPNNNVLSTIKSVSNCIFDKARRNEEEIVNPKIERVEIPGPGWYNVKNGQVPEGPKFSMRGVRKIPKIKNVPGPGAYDVGNKHRNLEPSYSIGKEKRSDETKITKKNNYPGPGTYKIVDKNGAPKFTFPKYDSRKAKKVEIPGPGFYKIPTSFNYISDITRSKGSFNPNYRYV